MTFDNTYAHLPEDFYQRLKPAPVAEPLLIKVNRPLAAELNLNLFDDDTELASIFSGNALMEGMDPIAMAYAGHQFGGFVPQLGDGRALLLGEVVNESGSRFDIQLKGSGRTRFSRGGDGRSALGPVIREYVVSEAMHALGIPTSRALAMVSTGEDVFREGPVPGGILTRVASGLVRVGTFEYFASRHMSDAVRQLADYVIDRHYPQARGAENPYIEWYRLVCEATARLVSQWMGVGFIHGVMNTDNTSIIGETLDYGPCAFMDTYDPGKVFSSIDQFGRYAYNNQPTIAQWNMAALGGCLLELFDNDPTTARSLGESVLEDFVPIFKRYYQQVMCAKIGLGADDDSFDLVRRLTETMHKDHVDFTVAFRSLTGDLDDFKALFSSEGIGDWIVDWTDRIKSMGGTLSAAQESIRAANPAFIPRNHRVEQAIRAAEDDGDYSLTHRLIEVLRRPYEDLPEYAEYMTPPKPDEVVHQTFCGT